MAPTLSLSKPCLDRVREAVSLAVVSIWELDELSGKKISCRSGFVTHHWSGLCMVLTLSKGLDGNKKIFVRFENGQCLEGFLSSDGGNSNLAAIFVDGLTFEPKTVSICYDEVRPDQDVIHMGFFDEENPELNFSSGSIALVGHNNTRIYNEEFTRFAHCCSEKLYLIGGPVFNLRGEVIGVNYSKKDRKNLYFALDSKQLAKDVIRLFGEDAKYLPHMVEQARRRRRKRKARTN